MRCALALVLLALLTPTPALGSTYREQRALAVAKEKWKRLPCDGQVTFARSAFSLDLGDATAMAVPPCTVRFNPARIDSLIWPFYCSVVVHEVGHLLGYGHSPDPRSVMYPTPGVYWRCKHSRDWIYRK